MDIVGAIVTTAQAARLIRVAAATIRKWVQRNLLTPVARGLFRLEDIQRVDLERRRAQTTHGGRKRKTPTPVLA